ncbi:hypothetical protein LTR96_007933 [Exophiala xenobiotica]|nr:hypothetical protein LTR92_002699 [Exophiala xenobiotica]KAK5207343.1 hypothetical protein LTR41_006912 [Exophiala xenobiotica]KAK5227995.1 hypothetical protein LTR72_001878 [Exophiala xenobiotica]KAK5238933.1 hypothetical protein LTR47_000676 [Exophiala xenobiotica]KAK5255855.1 hypothetical protein LTS06_000311 [Exophiala xenobiotica]
MHTIVLALAVGLLYLCISPIVVYFLDKNKLRRFPAPSVAGFTSLWLMRWSWSNERFRHVDQVHKELGPIVRIQPNHVSFADPAAFKDIYGPRSGAILKDVFYDGMAGDVHNMGDVRDRADHTRKRKMLSSTFSQKMVLDNLKPVILEVTEHLVDALDEQAQKNPPGGTNLYRWLNFFTWDAITEMAFSNSYGFLKQGDDVCLTENAQGQVRPVHAIDVFHGGQAFNSFISTSAGWHAMLKRFLSPTRGAANGEAFGGMAVYMAKQRLQKGAKGQHLDFFSQYPTEARPKDGDYMHFGELVAETALLLTAGNDTTASCLTNTLYLLMKNPHVMDKVRKEVDEALPESCKVAEWDAVKDLKYLRACIDESLRDRPPVGIGLPRVTPATGAIIAGHQIAGGVTVSVPTYTVHHDPQLFPNPHDYRPERWLEDPEEIRRLQEFCAPFSLGGRACIGRNLAYCELLIALATLLHRYNFELVDPDFELQAFERVNTNPGPLPAIVSLRKERKDTR